MVSKYFVFKYSGSQ